MSGPKSPNSRRDPPGGSGVLFQDEDTLPDEGDVLPDAPAEPAPIPRPEPKPRRARKREASQVPASPPDPVEAPPEPPPPPPPEALPPAASLASLPPLPAAPPEDVTPPAPAPKKGRKTRSGESTLPAPTAEAPTAPEAPAPAVKKGRKTRSGESTLPPPATEPPPPPPKPAPRPPPKPSTKDWVRAALAAAAVVQAAARGAPTILAARRAEAGAGRPETREEFLDRIQAPVEALIFAADHPLSAKELVQLLTDEGETQADVEGVTGVVARIQSRYAQPRSGLVIQEVAGGWAIRTSPSAAKFLQRSHDEKPFKLGRATLETLAIVAYRQPVTKPQIDDLRGVDSAGAVKSLLDRGLVKILGKAEDVGRPMLYGTTKAFLEAFNLRSLTELPTLREYHELNAEHQALVDAHAPRVHLGRISELARPDARLAAEGTESEGSHAMAELDRAMGEANASTRTAEALLKAGGKLPPGVKLETLRQPLEPPSPETDGAPAEDPAPPPSPVSAPADDDDSDE